MHAYFCCIFIRKAVAIPTPNGYMTMLVEKIIWTNEDNIRELEESTRTTREALLPVYPGSIIIIKEPLRETWLLSEDLVITSKKIVSSVNLSRLETGNSGSRIERTNVSIFFDVNSSNYETLKKNIDDYYYFFAFEIKVFCVLLVEPNLTKFYMSNNHNSIRVLKDNCVLAVWNCCLGILEHNCLLK